MEDLKNAGTGALIVLIACAPGLIIHYLVKNSEFLLIDILIGLVVWLVALTIFCMLHAIGKSFKEHF